MTIVAIVDSGLNLKHRDIVESLWVNHKEIPGNGLDDDSNGAIDDVHGFDTLTSAGLNASLANFGDPQGHGSHVAGIVTSLAPRAKIMPIRILDANGNGRMSDALFAWSYALENGAKIINNSFGVIGFPSAEFSFMEEAVRLGRKKHKAVFVAAAGNQSNNNDLVPATPANVPGMLSVGATNSSGNIASFSNFGKTSVHMFAPGDRIVSSDATSLSGSTIKSGTSQAAPMVSAVLAKLVGKKKNISAHALEKKLLKKLIPSPYLDDFSFTGSSLGPRFIRKITQLPREARSYRSARADPITGLRRYDRFIGVLDPSNGLTQNDVEDQLSCKGSSLYSNPDWPFDNIAVFSTSKSIRRSSGGCRGSQRKSGRVIGKPSGFKRARKAFNQVIDTGLFKSVEWDANISFALNDILPAENLVAPYLSHETLLF